MPAYSDKVPMMSNMELWVSREAVEMLVRGARIILTTIPLKDGKEEQGLRRAIVAVKGSVRRAQEDPLNETPLRIIDVL